MKYEVEIAEASYGIVEIEAENEEEAREKAIEEYHNGNVWWNSGDYEIGNVNKVEEG